MPFLRHDSGEGLEASLGKSSQGFGYDLTNFEYHLEIEGLLVGVFETLSGGDMAITTIEHDIVYESGASTTLLIPGTTSFGPFTLSRGFANYPELYAWFMLASSGRIVQARRNGSIIMQRYGQRYMQWDFDNAWPTKLSSFSFNMYKGSKARVAITIAPETITLVEVPGFPAEPPDLTTYFNELFAAPAEEES
jgi:phage tail-like protein